MTQTPTHPTLVLDASDEPPRALLSAVLRAPFEARTWKQLLYVTVAFILGCAGVCYLFFGIGGGLYLSVFLVGIPVLALVVLGGRVWGDIHRALCRSLLDTSVPAPPAFRRERGFLGFLRCAFTDRAAWRALLFLLAQAVLGMVVGYLVLTVVAMTLFAAVSPIPWLLFHPVNIDSEGVERHSLMQFGEFYVDTWPRVLGVSALGIIACFALPWLIRGVCLLHRLLTVLLLAATERDRQLVELRASRRAAVEDAAATLRRVERDLHDGTQARLVTIAMALGRAEERLAAGGDAGDLIADAHNSSKEALVELRELVRGIHPPALELGLGPALETLTARCAVPVELRVHLPNRPSPAVEAIAYFSVAELLTNIVEHAAADRAWVSVLPDSVRTIAVTVGDNGIGGVRDPGADGSAGGSGLRGLAARAASVDGSLTVHSPSGGPTVVRILLPKEDPQ
ncbi:sensor histidine kinase [Nocardia sp. NPDC001965]